MIRARLGALLVIAAVASATAISLQLVRAQINEDRRVMIVFVADSSFEELLAIPDVASLARAGGAALIARSEPLDAADHRMVSLGSDVGAHTVEFIHEHEPTLEHVLRHDARAVRTREERHHLWL